MHKEADLQRTLGGCFMDQDQPAIEVYGQILIHTDLSRLYDQNFTLRYVDPMGAARTFHTGDTYQESSSCRNICT